MRKVVMLRSLLSVSLIALSAGALSAQTPPEALRDAPGLSYEGQIGGMDIWSVSGQGGLYAVSPDGRTLIRGWIFSGTGRDIGAALTGSDPSTLLTAPEIRVIPSAGDPEPAGVETPQLVNTEGAAGFGALLGANTCRSPILANGPALVKPSTAGWDSAGRGNPPPLTPAPEKAETNPVDGAAITRSAEAALEGFSPEERRTLLLDLVAQLRGATTQEAFLQGIADWRASIDVKRAERGLAPLYSEDGTRPLETAEAMIPAPEVITVTTLPPSVQVAQPDQPVEVSAEANPDKPLAQTLLEDVRKNALWFSVGSNDVPAVYAFIDPTCPYSARAVAALSDKVGAGEIQLRVVLAPVVSERAAGLIAGILTDERPPLAFFDHEVALAERGRSDQASVEFSSLPGPVQAGIQRNFEMIRNYRIPGVPFFVYETEEGAKVLSGAPSGIDFPGALIDPYTGTK